jgi:hypothetical protein
MVIWRYAFAGLWVADDVKNKASTWLRVVSCLWWCALTLFQITCSLVILIWTILMLAVPEALAI